jgi:hypothetical protein
VSFLLNPKPLFFVTKVGLRVSAGVRIGWGILPINLSGTVGADLYLCGPPFGGYADFDFKLF